MDETIRQAIRVVSEGGIVVYPTDTAFGIGCRIDHTKSVDRLFTLRRRPSTQAMPVLVDSIDMALAYFIYSNDIVRHLMKTYWPGALTIVSWCDMSLVYSPIRGNGNTIGMRMPDHETPLSIISGIGVPMLGSSANFHGEKTPFRYKDLDPELIALVDYVVPGVCHKGDASTVVDTTTSPFIVLRQGAVKLVALHIDTSGIREACVKLSVGKKVYEKQSTESALRSQALLPLIEEVLAQASMTLSDITDITVVVGPGSFTGLRVGLSVANMLGSLFSIPVNGKKTLAMPVYS